MKINRILLLTGLFVLESDILCQTWEVVLTSGDTTRDLSFIELQGEVLIATRKGKTFSNLQTIDIKQIYQLRYLKKEKIRPSIKTQLVGIVGHSFVGYAFGYMMGNIVLWWFSYEDVGSLKLLGPRPEDINSGQKLIFDIATNISFLIGLSSGYDWKTEVMKEEKKYDLTNLSDSERREFVQSIIWPTQSNWINGIFKKNIKRLKQLIKKDSLLN